MPLPRATALRRIQQSRRPQSRQRRAADAVSALQALRGQICRARLCGAVYRSGVDQAAGQSPPIHPSIYPCIRQPFCWSGGSESGLPVRAEREGGGKLEGNEYCIAGRGAVLADRFAMRGVRCIGICCSIGWGGKMIGSTYVPASPKPFSLPGSKRGALRPRVEDTQ